MCGYGGMGVTGSGEQKEKQSSAREKRAYVPKTERDLDEANSERDVLLIILTPGVRLNERRSQTREAQCKFNYRAEGAGGKTTGTKPVPLARKSGRGRNPSIYMTAVCLGRLLMGEKRVVVIKGTRIPSSSKQHPSRMRLRTSSYQSQRVLTLPFRLESYPSVFSIFLLGLSSSFSLFLLSIFLPDWFALPCSFSSMTLFPSLVHRGFSTARVRLNSSFRLFYTRIDV